MALKNLGKYSDAIVQYNMSLELNPNHANTYNGKGNALENLKKY